MNHLSSISLHHFKSTYDDILMSINYKRFLGEVNKIPYILKHMIVDNIKMSLQHILFYLSFFSIHRVLVDTYRKRLDASNDGINRYILRITQSWITRGNNFKVHYFQQCIRAVRII